MTLQEMKSRLFVVEKQISEVTQWGAYLSVLDEERRGFIRSIEAQNN